MTYSVPNLSCLVLMSCARGQIYSLIDTAELDDDYYTLSSHLS